MVQTILQTQQELDVFQEANTVRRNASYIWATFVKKVNCLANFIAFFFF